MSIEYDSLPKNKKALDEKQKNTLKRLHKKNFKIKLSLLSLILFVLLVNLGKKNSHSSIKNIQLPLPAQKMALKIEATSPKKVSLNKKGFTLNGVFISDEYKTAMINNQFYQIGDTIKDMKLVTIQYDKVKLINDKYILQLP